jgi:acyl-CoA synthetase (AMP-forming)/AMP-acid ligase II
VGAAAVPPRDTVGVGSWIERHARVAPDRPALLCPGRELTYAQLAARIRRLAHGLRGLGVGRGDRVGWLGANDPAFLELLFATGLVGGVLAPVNHRLPGSARAGVLADTQPVVLVEQHEVAGSTPGVPPSVRQRVVVGAPTGGDPRGAIDIEALIAGAPDRPIGEPVGADDLLLLPHTSGTTGRPKAVMLSHGNVIWNAVNMLTSADLRRDDVTIAIAPFFRTGGTGVNVLPVLLAGGTVVMPGAADGDTVLEAMERHRVTVGFGNPDLLDALAACTRWAIADLSPLRFIITGGAPVPERLVRAFLDRGVTLLQGYGLSEAGPVVSLLDPASALDRGESAGRPVLFVDTRIVDDDGHDASPGETGELLVRGPNVMGGYWKRPDATAAALRPDGWLRTGDAARADDEGYLWIVDRFDSRFVTSGGPVYPGDVERVLLTHPGVADAGVVAVPGHAVGVPAVGVAFVVPAGPEAPAGSGAPTEAALIAFARDRLPAHAVPASVRFVTGLPRNSVGKLDRGALAARLSTTT